MRDFYCLFSDAMALAVVEGRKTITRRPVALREFGTAATAGYEWEFRDRRALWNSVSTELLMEKFAPCAPGDTLVGRESFWQPARTCCSEDQSGEREYYTKRAHEAAYGPTRPAPARTDGYAWERRPSIHMPRWASRIVRPVVSVRVERLQEIDEADARAEGVAPLFTPREIANVVGLEKYRTKPVPWTNYLWHGTPGLTRAQVDSWPWQFSGYETARDSFSSLWHSIYAAKGLGWVANPWVWRIEFGAENHTCPPK
jgi:hypothetical protein